MKTLRLLLVLVVLMAFVVSACDHEPQQAVKKDPAKDERDKEPPTAAVNRAPFEARDRDPVPIFPKSPMPSHLYVLDMQSASAEMRLLLATLQGVLAKTDPRLFLLYSADVDGFWLNEMADHYGVAYEYASDPWALLDQFVDELSGFIVYDPDLTATINIGTTMAGIADAVLAAPALIGDLEAHGLAQVDDLRGRFADPVELTAWAMANVWPDANHTIMGFLDPNLPLLRDYMTAHNILALMLDPHVPDQRALLDQVLAETPPNIPLLGWAIDELLGVILFSRGSKFHVASDWARNLSTTSGLPRPELTQDHAPPVETVDNTIYVAFALTDGDNVAYSLDTLWRQWNDPARGQVPIGWEVSFNLIDIAPQAIRYYYETKSENDMFIAPACGVGYIYPSQYPDLPTFLAMTQPYMAAADMDTIWLINDDLTLPDAIAVAYAEALNLLGIYIDYWPNLDKGYYLASDGTPVLRSQYVYLIGPEQIAQILADKKVEKDFFYPDEPFFLFIGVNGWTVTPTMIKGIVDSLDDSYTVLRPDAMFQAMRKAAELGYEF